MKSMFADFANVWTIVALARDVPAGKAVPLRVAGERLVLFRDADGRIAGLVDRCPHRGVALSLGEVKDGRLTCPFHGWTFDGAGRNCHVPWNPDAKRETLGATALVVREVAGLVWLYTGFAPLDEPQPIEVLDRADVTLCAQSVLWETHWTRVMENMLDSPHLPFVHKRTIGRALAPYVGGRMDVDWTPTAFGAILTNTVEGRERPARLDYRFPNAMELHIDPPGRLLRMLAICTPETDRSTRLTIVTIRNFARWRLLDPLFARLNRKIAAEDQQVLESSDPMMVPPAGQEKSVRTDAPTLAFRKIYFERLKGSRAERSGGA